MIGIKTLKELILFIILLFLVFLTISSFIFYLIRPPEKFFEKATENITQKFRELFGIRKR
ncbi:MAG: hypothetical protein RMJ17_01625 [Candidatus Aenigmarchaeota archaeon]|nr:hypothetical protein [Candidatus Aenigmarchaeota archaeon]MDW8149277.1 hypothetical protein [Candidatus Aenigmarchaeota archaeon]